MFFGNAGDGIIWRQQFSDPPALHGFPWKDYSVASLSLYLEKVWKWIQH
jgi:hypothetical protein